MLLLLVNNILFRNIQKFTCDYKQEIKSPGEYVGHAVSTANLPLYNVGIRALLSIKENQNQFFPSFLDLSTVINLFIFRLLKNKEYH